MSTGEQTEHALQMSGGGYHVRASDPELERIYPLHEWILNKRSIGAKVYRRRIIIIQDWHEVGAFDE